MLCPKLFIQSMDIRTLIREVLQEMVARSYRPDLSDEALENELHDAQGEKQQTVGPNDTYEDLFGDYKHPQVLPIADICPDSRLEDFRYMVQRQGEYGTNTVKKFISLMKRGKPLPPVVAWQHGPGRLELVSGRHRILAAVELGMTHVPCIIMYWRSLEG